MRFTRCKFSTFTAGNTHMLTKIHLLYPQAIIDIDGNNWSSRFGMLLCMNSVVIKVSTNSLQFLNERMRVHIFTQQLLL